MRKLFDHEKLDVYQKAIHFCGWAGPLIDKVPSKLSACDQLDRASTSIPLNIAGGNGKYGKRDRCRFLDIAKGSSVECAAALDVLVARRYLTEKETIEGKELLVDIVAMLTGLLKTHAPDRVYDERATYNMSEHDYEHEQEELA